MKRPAILLAEDNQTDALMVQQFFQKAGILSSLQQVNNGENALAYLRGDGIYADRARYPFPILLLLDLNMPRKSGWDVLEWLRHNPIDEPLGLVVLTGETDIKIMHRAYKLGAHTFLVKPLQFEDFLNLIRYIPGIHLNPELAVPSSSNPFRFDLIS